jgi:hypothetical protein
MLIEMFTHKLQITRQHDVSTFVLNMRWNQILLQVAAILLLVLPQLYVFHPRHACIYFIKTSFMYVYNKRFKTLNQEQLFLTGKMKHLRTTSAWFICKYPLYLRTNEVKIHRFFYAGLYYSVLVRKQKTLKIVCFYHELIQTQFWIQTSPRQSDVHVDSAVIVPEMRMCWNFPGMEFMIYLK